MAKVAIITGATSGIGLACAKLLISKGYKVYGVARRPYGGDDFYCFEADVCDYASMAHIFGEVYKLEGRIDALINNAGFGIAGAVEDASEESIQKIADVNLTALCVLCGRVIPYMKINGGRIINISSVGGIMPLPYQAMYSATKAGVEVFSRALATEVKGDNIKVTAVLPGDTKTGFTEARVFEGDSKSAQKSVEKMARDEQHGKDPSCVAKVIYRCLNKKRPPLRVAVGGLSKLEIFLSRFVSARCLNKIIAKLYG